MQFKKFKTIQFNKSQELDKYLMDGWVIHAVFQHQSKAIVVLGKV